MEIKKSRLSGFLATHFFHYFSLFFNQLTFFNCILNVITFLTMYLYNLENNYNHLRLFKIAEILKKTYNEYENKISLYNIYIIIWYYNVCRYWLLASETRIFVIDVSVSVFECLNAAACSFAITLLLLFINNNDYYLILHVLILGYV